jgi:hypothetical protein
MRQFLNLPSNFCYHEAGESGKRENRKTILDQGHQEFEGKRSDKIQFPSRCSSTVRVE